MAAQRDLVLLLPRDAPLLSGDFHVPAHRETGGRLSKGRRIGSAEPFHPACDAGANAPLRNGIRNDRRRTQTRNAVGRDGLRLDGGGKASLEHDFPSEIGLALLRNDGAKGDGLNSCGINGVALQETPYGVLSELERT